MGPKGSAEREQGVCYSPRSLLSRHRLLALAATLLAWSIPYSAIAQGAAEAEEPTDEALEEPTDEPLASALQLEEPELHAGDASSAHPRMWRDEFGSAGMPNYVMIGATALLTIGHIVLSADRARPDLGRNDFDEAARDAVRLPTDSQRLVIRDLSDALLTLATSTPILFDALILAAWANEDEEAALQMILIHAEVIAATLALQTFANVVMSRERPYGRTCGGPGPDDLDEESFFCDAPDRYYSFFSGHASQAFASAAVLCSFHMNMPLMGDGAENTVLPCVAGFTIAAATSVFRMMSDMHYASDILAGAAVGTAMGFLIPWLLHFNPRDAGEGSVSVVPSPTGVSVVGLF